jgi:general secretion pathway protein J
MIEALAAVALTAAIVTSLSAVAGQWLPNWSRGFARLQQSDLVAIGLERIVEDISAAEYVTVSAESPGPLFEGGQSSITFIRSAIGPDSYPHLEVIRLAEVNDERGPAMTRSRASFAPVARSGAATFAFRDSVSLVRAPFRISFAYAGPDRVWVGNWTARDRLPDAVRVTVRDATTNKTLPFSTALRVRATAQGVPKLEAQAVSGNKQSPPSTSSPVPAPQVQP